MKLLKGLLQSLEKWHQEEEERRKRIAALPFWQGCWEEMKHSFKRYFQPLTRRWFWLYVFPPILIYSMVMAYYEVYCK